MFQQISDITVKVYLVVGTVFCAYVAVSGLVMVVGKLFKPCYTVLPDGTPSEQLDSFHLRSWLIGLGIPSYRMTAIKGLARCLACVLIAVAFGFLGALLAFGLV